MNKDVELNIVSFHGLYSQGNNLEILVNRLEHDADGQKINCVTSQHDYPKLNVTMGIRKWARDMTRDYLMKCLSLEFYKFPQARLVVLCHSNATYAIARAIEKQVEQKGLVEKFRIDKLILFGSVIKRNYDWSRFPDIKVCNFVGKRDRVVFMAKAYGMGWSGKYGFKKESTNLKQHYLPWRHSDFVDKGYELIKSEVI